MKNPFDFFDRIVVINLEECKDRLERFRKMAQEYGFDFEVFPAVKDEIGSYGCSRSHFEIIKQAKKDGLKHVLVFEDDCVFLYPKEYVWEQVSAFFRLKKCDVFYLGGNFVWETESQIKKRKTFAEYQCLGRFSLVYNSSSFDWLIKNNPSKEKFLKDRKFRGDVFLSNSGLIKKGCKTPLTSVDSQESFTGTNAEKIYAPIESGREHFALVLSAYFRLGLVDCDNIEKRHVWRLFRDAHTAKKYRKKIYDIVREINPFDFVKVRCINLKSDKSRWKTSVEQFEKYGVKCERFEAIRNKSGWAGSTLSHRKVVQEAKNQGFDRVLILEDDFLFTKDKESVWICVRNLLSQSFEIGYLGFTLTEKANCVFKDVYSVKKGYGLYAYIMDESCFDKFLSNIPDRAEEISRENRKVSDIVVYDSILPDGKCLLTPVCTVREGFSYNWNKQRDGIGSEILKRYEQYLIGDFVPESEEVGVYVLNRKEDVLRLKSISRELSKLNVVFKRVEPVWNENKRFVEKANMIRKDKDSLKKAKELSHRLTFIELLSRSCKHKHLVIFEDDCVLEKDFYLKEIISRLPKNYGVCFIGGYFRRGDLQKYKKGLLKIKSENGFLIYGTHAVIVNGKKARDVAECLMRSEGVTTDVQICREFVPKNDCFIVYPQVAFQKAFYPAIHESLDLEKLKVESEQKIEEVLK